MSQITNLYPPIVELRRNLAPDPRATVNAAAGVVLGWTVGRWFGSAPAAGTHTWVTGAADGPLLPDGSKLATYLRKTWTTPPASMGGSGDSGFQTGPNRLPVVAGSLLAMSAWVRPSVRRNMEIGLQYHDQAGATLGARVKAGKAVAEPATWLRLEHVALVPAGATSVQVIFDSTAETTNGAQLWAAGSTLDATGLLVEVNAGPVVGPYFDGSTPAVGQTSHAWAGAANASVSIQSGPDPVRTYANPLLVLGWETSADSGNILHKLLDGTIVPSLAPAGMRRGTMRLLFDAGDHQAALAAFELHRQRARFELHGSPNPAQAVRYVLDGQMQLALSDNAKRWVLSVPYQEVP